MYSSRRAKWSTLTLVAIAFLFDQLGMTLAGQ
jgi:hypothetical protein